MTTFATGRIAPRDFSHTARYALRGAVPQLTPPKRVERVLALPRGIKALYAQGRLNACVGASLCMYMAILNATDPDECPRYDWRWLWERAKELDPWPETRPGDNNGTAVSVGFDVLRTEGLVRVGKNGQPRIRPTRADGIGSNSWAGSVDEVRAAIALGLPVEFGTAWSDAMMRPVEKGGIWTLPETLGDPLDLGHAYVVVGASDRYEGFWIPNTFGPDWPAPGVDCALLPYRLAEELLAEEAGGEAGVAVDRPPKAKRKKDRAAAGERPGPGR